MSDTCTSQNQTSARDALWALQGSPALGGVLLNTERVMALTGSAAQLLGLSSPEAQGLPLQQLPGALLPLIQEILAGPPQQLKRTIEMATLGRPTTLVEVIAVSCGENAHERHVLLFLRDAGFSTEMRRRLTHLDRLLTLGTLSANVAHEVRNGFVAVKTFIDLLIERNQDKELANLVQREVLRIDELLMQALRIAEPAPPILSLLPINAVLERTLRILEPPLRKNSIIVQRDLAAAPDRIEGVENELQQVVMNLVLNAIEAMGTAGTLSIASRLEPSEGQANELVVSIRDTGPGISAEHQARLFEPFFTTKPGGTGLGLAITQRIMAEHRGSVNVHSTSQGTEFTLRFPTPGSGI